MYLGGCVCAQTFLSCTCPEEVSDIDISAKHACIINITGEHKFTEKQVFREKVFVLNQPRTSNMKFTKSGVSMFYQLVALHCECCWAVTTVQQSETCPGPAGDRVHSQVCVEPFMFGKQRKKHVPIVRGVVCPQLPRGAAPCRIQPLPVSVRGGLCTTCII